MRTTPVLLALLAGLSLSGPGWANQTVWKWVDASGVTHYSDRPVPGATKVDIHVGSSANPPNPPLATGNSNSSPAETAPAYRNFEVWKPGKEEHIINTGGVVPVEVRVDPSLQPGHSLYVYLDGRLVEGYPPNTASFELQEVPRGMHTVRAVISDDRGTRLQETQQVIFYVQQNSVAQPPVGPTLRPPPKPRPQPQRKAGNQLPSQQPTFAQLNKARTAAVDSSTNWPAGSKPGNRAATDPSTNYPVGTQPAKSTQPVETRPAAKVQ